MENINDAHKVYRRFRDLLNKSVLGGTAPNIDMVVIVGKFLGLLEEFDKATDAMRSRSLSEVDAVAQMQHGKNFEDVEDYM